MTARTKIRKEKRMGGKSEGSSGQRKEGRRILRKARRLWAVCCGFAARLAVSL